MLSFSSALYECVNVPDSNTYLYSTSQPTWSGWALRVAPPLWSQTHSKKGPVGTFPSKDKHLNQMNYLNISWDPPCALFPFINLPSCPISVCPLSSVWHAGVSTCPADCCSPLLSSPVHILPITALAPLNSKFFVFSTGKIRAAGEQKCLLRKFNLSCFKGLFTSTWVHMYSCNFKLNLKNSNAIFVHLRCELCAVNDCCPSKPVDKQAQLRSYH